MRSIQTMICRSSHQSFIWIFLIPLFHIVCHFWHIIPFPSSFAVPLKSRWSHLHWAQSYIYIVQFRMRAVTTLAHSLTDMGQISTISGNLGIPLAGGLAAGFAFGVMKGWNLFLSYGEMSISLFLFWVTKMILTERALFENFSWLYST